MLMMLGLLAGKAPNRNQMMLMMLELMLMMLGLLAGKAQTKPADAHDAGPFGGESPNRTS